MQRITSSSQPAAPPPPESIEDIRAAVVSRVKPILSEIWPAAAPLQDFDVAFASSGIVFNVRYAGDRELGKIPLSMIVQQLQEKLGSSNIALNATRVRMSRKPAGSTK